MVNEVLSKEESKLLQHVNNIVFKREVRRDRCRHAFVRALNGGMPAWFGLSIAIAFTLATGIPTKWTYIAWGCEFIGMFLLFFFLSYFFDKRR